MVSWPLLLGDYDAFIVQFVDFVTRFISQQCRFFIIQEKRIKHEDSLSS